MPGEEKQRKYVSIRGERTVTKARLKTAMEILDDLCKKHNGYLPLPYLIHALVEKLGVSRTAAYIYANTLIQTAGYKTVDVAPVYIILCK